MFKGREQISSKGRGVADRLFERDLFIIQTERLGAFKRSTIRGNGFVESKDFFRRRRGLLCVIEPTLIIARLNVMMSQCFNGNACPIAMTFKPFRGATMKSPAPNGIQLFVEHLANLVVSERERFASLGHQKLRR